MVGENYSPQQQKIQRVARVIHVEFAANRFFHGSAGRRGGAIILCLPAAFLSLRLAGLAVAAVVSPPGET